MRQPCAVHADHTERDFLSLRVLLPWEEEVSHAEQRDFFHELRAAEPFLFEDREVLEIGSLDINGTIRDFFVRCDYTGVDLQPGPGVDVVGEGQLLNFPDESFDVVVSAECFEHNPFWRETFINMHRMSREVVIFTCATEGRAEHGTSRTTPGCSPFTVDKWDYYRNLTEDDFSDLPLDDMFNEWNFTTNHLSHDLYFVGWVNK